MADKEADKEKAADAAPKKKGGGSKIILFTIVGVIILGGGGAGAFFMMRRGNTAEAKPVEKKAEANKGGVVAFEPFVVNLADGGRFLRLTVRLVVDEAEEAEKIQKSEVTVARARSEILELLTEQTSDKL